jgi:hypothetical protein
MQNLENLNPAEIIALAKVVKAAEAKKASTELAVGNHDVDFTVRVTGSLKRGADYTQQIVAKADPWTLLAAALSHLNGVTVDSLVKEALAADPALVKSLKANAAEAIAKVKGPTDTACNGKVTTKVAAGVA